MEEHDLIFEGPVLYPEEVEDMRLIVDRLIKHGQVKDIEGGNSYEIIIFLQQNSLMLLKRILSLNGNITKDIIENYNLLFTLVPGAKLTPEDNICFYLTPYEFRQRLIRIINCLASYVGMNSFKHCRIL